MSDNTAPVTVQQDGNVQIATFQSDQHGSIQVYWDGFTIMVVVPELGTVGIDPEVRSEGGKVSGASLAATIYGDGLGEALTPTGFRNPSSSSFQFPFADEDRPITWSSVEFTAKA